MEEQYKYLLTSILNNGEVRPNRTGTKSVAMFGMQLKYNVSKQFPLLTSKHISFKVVETEFQWFINGETDIKRFAAKNIHIWDAWADADGNLGPVYGYQMLQYNGESCNQLQNVIWDLIHNPYSRRHIITLWNPLQIREMHLPPCYLYFQFFVHTNGKLDMFVVQRSADMFAGVPYDIAVFARFLIYISRLCNLYPNEITLNLADAHIYVDHIPGVHLYLKNPVHSLPTWEHIDDNKIKIIDYKHESKIKINIAI